MKSGKVTRRVFLGLGLAGALSLAGVIKGSEYYFQEPQVSEEREKNAGFKGNLDNFKFGESDSQIGHIYLPGSQKKHLPKESWKTQNLLVYIHGGAWGAGSPSDYSTYHANYFSEEGIPAVSIGYELIDSRNKDPSKRGRGIEGQIEDCFKGIRHSLEILSKKHSIENPSLVLMGDSAGGHLAIKVALENAKLSPKERLKIQGALGISGIYDLNIKSGAVDNILEGNYGTNEKARKERLNLSPVNDLSLIDPQNAPELGVITFEGDYIVNPNQAKIFYEEAKKRKIPMKHYEFNGMGGHVLGKTNNIEKPSLKIHTFNGSETSEEDFSMDEKDYLRKLYKKENSNYTPIDLIVHGIERDFILKALKRKTNERS